jgi:FkbM family methyltransferase
MRTVRFVDGDDAAAALAIAPPLVCASVASVPGRERGLAEVVGALLPQVDRLCVYLNGYEHVPSFLDAAKVRVVRSQESGDRGDGGKFFWAERSAGFAVVCDDDLRYPADYVARLVAGIERYQRRAIVGFHGAVLDDEFLSYYRSRRLYHFASALRRDTPVHVLGTGAAGYHHSALAVSARDFLVPDVADVSFALLGQRQRVPFVCLEHERGWLQELAGLATGSIFARQARLGRASAATGLARDHGPWTLHALPAAADHADAEARAQPPGRRESLGRLVRVPVAGPRRRASVLLPEGDHITVMVQRRGTYYERDLLDAIRSRAGPGTYVDVGAHYGNHTLFFALECDAEHVVAIEPHRSSFEGLLANLNANRIDARVTALHIAIHSTLRRVRTTPLPWQPGRGAAARTNSGLIGVVAADGPGSVQATPLDDALASSGQIAVVKIDAEALGPDIVASGIGVLARDRPLVAVEAGSEPLLARIRALLEPLGYSNTGRFCATPTWLWTADAD